MERYRSHYACMSLTRDSSCSHYVFYTYSLTEDVNYRRIGRAYKDKDKSFIVINHGFNALCVQLVFVTDRLSDRETDKLIL